MKVVLIASVVLLCLSFVSMNDAKILKMVVNVIQSFNKPCHVVANLCWGSFEKKQLMDGLGSVDNPKTVKFVQNMDLDHFVLREKTVFLVDLSCPSVTSFFNKANSSRIFNKPYRWLIVGSSVDEGFPSELDNLQILPDSEVYLSQSNGNDSFIINLIYKIKLGRDWISEYYGTWTNNGVIKSRISETSVAMRRKNLAQETIVTSMVVTDDSTITDLFELRYPLIDSVSKSLTQQLMPLYYFMNATARVIHSDTWGYFVNGSWSGMLGDMVEGRAELAGTLLFITEQRIEVQEFLTYPSSFPVRFIFHEPPLSYQNNLYLLPFNTSVWYCCGSFVVVMIVVLLINAQWEAKKLKKESANTVLFPSVSEVTVFVVSAITQQGSTVELKGSLGRVVIFILFLAFLFLYTAYSASIVVLLQSSSNQIRTLSDLLQSKLEIGAEDTPYNRFWFAAAKDPVRKAIYEKKLAPKGSIPKFYGMVEGIKMMQNKPFAFHANLGVGYQIIQQYFQEHEKCGFQEITFLQDSTPWSSCYKLSPYKEIFKIGQIRIQEHGIANRINHLIFAKRPVCSVRGGRFVSVSIVDCYPSMLVLLYGLVLAVMILFVEILYDKRCSARKRVSASIVSSSRDTVSSSGLSSVSIDF
uniref:Ionotropic Receptor n=1 Tax=Epiphyas postvittana TaxID=65032 RepID=A0A0K8TUC6_EPIPO